jgi:predicted membrane protein
MSVLNTPFVLLSLVVAVFLIVAIPVSMWRRRREEDREIAAEDQAMEAGNAEADWPKWADELRGSEEGSR